VRLITTENSELSGQWPLPAETPYLADADLGELTLTPAIAHATRIELRMAAQGRGGFGETRTFVLQLPEKVSGTAWSGESPRVVAVPHLPRGRSPPGNPARFALC